MKTKRYPSTHARIAVLFAVVGCVTLLSGCDRAGSQPQHGMPPAEVAVVAVESKDLPVTFEYAGQTTGSREVEVRARVPGILQKRNYREGGPVAAGQSLFTIDPAQFEAALARAEADVASAEARLAHAKRGAARMKPLYEAKAVSQKEYDDAVSNEAIAEADAKAARARHTEAKLNLSYTKVESPIAGIAGRAQRSDGNFVSGPDVLLTTVSQTNPIYVLFGISDEERRKIDREAATGRLVLPKNGQFDVSVKLAEGSLYPHSGKLNFSDVRISGTTGTSEARAELPNPKGVLRPGQFVRVVLQGARRPGAILIPQRAVLEGPQGKFVYIVNAENKAEPRPVDLGDWQEGHWVVTGGLKPGEKVIVDGVMKIGPGAPVRVAEANASPGTPAGAPPGGPQGAPSSTPKPGAPAKGADQKPAGHPPAEKNPKS